MKSPPSRIRVCGLKAFRMCAIAFVRMSRLFVNLFSTSLVGLPVEGRYTPPKTETAPSLVVIETKMWSGEVRSGGSVMG